MDAVELVLVLMAATAALGVLSARLGLPQPVLMVLGGALIALLPFSTSVQLAPEVVFLIFVPPLLYRAALQTSLYEFRRRIASIAFLSFAMVLATVAVVAVSAHAIIPGLGWGPAFVLGAIVSPPDSVAAIALTQRLRLPRNIVTVLRGEGLVNDAAAFVSFRIALATVVSGTFSAPSALVDFVAAAGLGIGTGVAAGWIVARLRESLHHMPAVENTISLLTPFAAYIPAERMGASGVLAVVAVGLYLGGWAPRRIRPATRLQADAMWDMIVFLLEGLIFVLVGFELPRAFVTLQAYPLPSLALWATVVSAAVMLSRLALVFPGLYAADALRWKHERGRVPLRWQHVFFVGWAGVRGGESLVIALSLPALTAAGAPLPARDLVIILTFIVILATLLLQGLTLQPLMALLGIRDNGADRREEALARRRLHAAAAAAAATPAGLAGAAQRLVQLRALEAQRRELLRLFETGRVGDVVMRKLLHELDLQSALLESS